MLYRIVFVLFILIGSAQANSDFDGSGTVDFPDFLLFVGAFGAQEGDEKYDTRFDLDGDSVISFSDFLVFVGNFGKEVTQEVINTDFALDREGTPRGITYMNNKFYVVYSDTVTVYTQDGQITKSGGFSLYGDEFAYGITHDTEKLYVVKGSASGDYVDAYTTSGQWVESVSFALDTVNRTPFCITYENNRFYIGDLVRDRVFVYTKGGEFMEAEGFDLTPGRASGIAYANDKFYVTDSEDDKVYVYTDKGQRVEGEDFDLAERNSNPRGIVYINGKFYVVDAVDKVYVYPRGE